MEPQQRSSRRPLDATALQRIQRRLNAAAQPPWLHTEVARRMAERLLIIKQRPETVIDWGAFVGAGRSLLRQAYPRARLLAVESDASRRAASADQMAMPWWSPQRWVGPAAEVRLQTEIGAGHGQLLWSNMGLHFAPDPQAVMAQWHRALAVDGFLMFSTLGPGSLAALRSLYAGQGWPEPFAPFVDMHDLGDMLVQAGFADPVMDQEIITLTWPSADRLLAELRGLGGNASPKRLPGLRTPRWRERLLRALAGAADAQGRIALDFEIVYGHAFRPLPRPRVAAETALSADDLRSMARAGRRPGSGRAHEA